MTLSKTNGRLISSLFCDLPQLFFKAWYSYSKLLSHGRKYNCKVASVNMGLISPLETQRVLIGQTMKHFITMSCKAIWTYMTVLLLLYKPRSFAYYNICRDWMMSYCLITLYYSNQPLLLHMIWYPHVYKFPISYLVHR